ncbi:MAG: alpha/beta fold hydrolase [Chloroflexi bacterium]|nr:alpha/beta fold hydrolase [Chloroflexota bacterium]
MLIPTTEPFFFRGGPVGCLLIHGFTSSPKEMRWLGESLAGRGHTVLGVRLAHHATQPADMNRSRWHDWYYSAVDGWHVLRDQCERIFPIGLSMGGVTALKLAAEYPVAGVVAMGTPMRPARSLMSFSDWLWPFIPFMKKGPRIWDDPSVAEWHTAYTVYPVRASGELRRYMRVVDDLLPCVTAPALLMHSRADRTVPPQTLEYICNRLGSTDKETFWVERSNHIITEDSEKEIVFQKIGAWIEARANL